MATGPGGRSASHQGTRKADQIFTAARPGAVLTSNRSRIRNREPELFGTKADGVAWQTKPSWYIVANNDNAVNPELERFVAKRMNATTYDIDSSHVPMLSHPDFVINVIRDAIKGV